MRNSEISMKRFWPLLGGLVAVGAVVGGIIYALVPHSAPVAPPVAVRPVDASAEHVDDHGSDSDLRPTSVAVNTKAAPLPFHESPQGKAILRAFDELAHGDATASEYAVSPALWETLEHNLTDHILPSGMKSFYDNVMVKGPWQVVGRPIASTPTTQAYTERGRLVEPRFVYLLIEQGSRYMQAKVQADFLIYADGRVMVSQAGLAIKEMKYLDAALVSKYRAAHGL